MYHNDNLTSSHQNIPCTKVFLQQVLETRKLYGAIPTSNKQTGNLNCRVSRVKTATHSFRSVNFTPNRNTTPADPFNGKG